MKRRSQFLNTRGLNTTATSGFIFRYAPLITRKETGLPPLISGFIRNSQGKEEAL